MQVHDTLDTVHYAVAMLTLYVLWRGRYNLIGKTSALTFNVAAVLRNWILIFLSSVPASCDHEYPLVPCRSGRPLCLRVHTLSTP